MGAEQGFGKPWELHRYHAATNPLIQTAFEESVTRNQKPVKDTHIEVARQVNEIQAKEHASRAVSSPSLTPPPFHERTE